MEENKLNALITGGSRGIGKAVVNIFEKKGYEVLCPSRAELDLSDSISVEAFIQKYKNHCFDTVINNAGINEINFLEEVSDEELNRILTVNLIAPIKLLRGLVPGLKKSKAGRIVNIGSIWAVVSKEGRSLYSATKNGLYGITNTLALELAPASVLVNMVCPGYTSTEMTSKNNTEEQLNAITQNIPLGRMAEPHEIANLVYLVGSENNTYITGQKLSIDGGFSIQ